MSFLNSGRVVVGSALCVVLGGLAQSCAAEPAASGPAQSDESVVAPASTDEPGAGQAGARSPDNEILTRMRAPFAGDLSKIKERRALRVLVSYSRSNFFIFEGRTRGFEVELFEQFGEHLNKGIRVARDRTEIVFIPTPFDRLLDELIAGHGDVAAAGLTVTDERAQRVAFTDPYIPNVRELVVTHRGVDGLGTVDDLSGRAVYVRAGSSYARHLAVLSDRLAAAGRPPIEVVEADPHLATEDILELINAGVVEITVTDHHIAAAWSSVLPKIVVRDDLEIASRGSIAWAVRKENPDLRASLNGFIRGNKKGTLLGNILFNRYFKDSTWIKNPTADAERAKLDALAALFREYGDRYEFDWLALAAQGYQESQLDQSKQSSAGAIGVMQLKPSTAADQNVGISDITEVENNIHAGAKYMDFIRDRYFADPEISKVDQFDFAWAAYNAGPARIRQLRTKAEEQGLDGNRWLNNVERVAPRETVIYVGNINKYWVAYRLFFEMNLQRQLELESMRTKGRSGSTTPTQ